MDNGIDWFFNFLYVEKGRSEGEREATLRIARTMLQSGIDRNTVMAMTGLTEEDLQRITH
ncbi:hypothetical protein B8031_14995 [Klebsiella pneumoniae]|nr:hypothetical protein B8031_14995 [Klebsiella pneumoniae]